MPEPRMPDSLEKHQGDYQEDAWKQYTYDELAHWIHNLVKRAKGRKNLAKKKKDLYDADNYRKILNAKLDAEMAEIDEDDQQGVLIADP